MKRRFATPSLVSLTILLACSAEPNRDTTATASAATQPTGVTAASVTTDAGTDSGSPTTTGGTGTSEAVTSGASDSSSSSGSTGGPKFDIPPSADVGETTGVPQVPCMIDFLFVIDNSTSMEDNQVALSNSFEGFIQAIQATVGDDTNFHVMVVDTDAQSRCETLCDTPNDPLFDKFCAAKNGYACTAMLEECDNVRGAGVVHPVGSDASNKKCQLFGGNRYMVAEEPDLAGTFACVAKVGTAGAPAERPMNAIQAAVGYGLNSPMGCNAGFLREEAILVITFLSDDGNYVDQGTPDEWKASIVEAKGGDEDRVVVLGLIPHPELDCINPMTDDNTQGKHWEEFIQLWGPRGFSGSICELDYTPFFADAIETIDKTCDANPPG